MFNLLELYKNIVIKELIGVYTKTVLIKEFISIFPIISKLDFNTDYFDQYCHNLINEKYILPILNIIKLKIDINEINTGINNAIQELKNVLKTLNLDSFSIKDNFPLSFPQYDVEKYEEAISLIGHYGKLDDNKYAVGNLYIEKYIRVKDDSTAQVSGISNRSLGTKEVTNIKALYDFINNRNITSENLFKVIKQLFLGIRLIYIPNIIENKETLFNNLIKDEIVQLEKTNAIAGTTSNLDHTEYFFPLQLCKLEEELLDTSFFNKDTLLQFLDITSSQQPVRFTNLIKRFWDSEEFNKLFSYHIPVQIFEVLIPNDQLRINELLKDVYNKNLTYSNLEQILITLIDHIINADDPTKI